MCECLEWLAALNDRATVSGVLVESQKRGIHHPGRLLDADFLLHGVDQDARPDS